MDDLSLRVYLENAADADRGGWLELPVVPERLDAFMRGVVGVDDGGGYAVVDHEPGWFGDVLGSGLEDTLRRIRSARAGMGDFDEVAREVMGVEQFRPEMYDDDYGSVALDLGYVLPAPLASFEPRPVAASAPDGADPTLFADDSAASSRLV